ncbi:hypothetical protein BT93_L2914 [Corymbia citriodora subsp. variegata]|uniref:Bet v I/Major latex protein domain-containing protein n=1 Tax=Corymbia citriodora subsp. variegata TaxID=360336 RepID=A0A8T0CL12_CORYI|nr:hypothetical protein BT93_L2914 [Corymbia citriodora subsp. variegata]
MQNMETAQCAKEMAQAEKLLGGTLTPAEKFLVGILTQTKALRSSAEELFNIYRNEPYRFPDLTKERYPDLPKYQIESVELLEGEWDQVGSKRRWTFVDDQCGTWDDMVEDINDQAMSITWTLKKGIVPQQRYKMLKVVHQFFARKHGCLATVTLVYMKKHVGIPAPHDYMKFLIKMLEAADEAGTNEE